MVSSAVIWMGLETISYVKSSFLICTCTRVIIKTEEELGKEEERDREEGGGRK